MACNLLCVTAMRAPARWLAAGLLLTSACETVDHYRVRDADLLPFDATAPRPWIPAVRLGDSKHQQVLLHAKSIDARGSSEMGTVLVRSRATNHTLGAGVAIGIIGGLLLSIGGGSVIDAAVRSDDYYRRCDNECLGVTLEYASGGMILGLAALPHLIAGAVTAARGAAHPPQEKPIDRADVDR